MYRMISTTSIVTIALTTAEEMRFCFPVTPPTHAKKKKNNHLYPKELIFLMRILLRPASFLGEDSGLASQLARCLSP